jgi:midasin
LIWAVEGWSQKEGSLRYLLRCLLPTILSKRSKHLWSNSFVKCDVIAMSLELPNMWVDDEVKPSHSRWRLEQGSQISYGSANLRQQVRSEFILRVVGKQIAFLKSPDSTSKFHTMENHLARLVQYREMVKMLSSLPIAISKESLFVAQYLLIDILEASRDSFGNRDIDLLISMARQPALLLGDDADHLLLFQKSSNAFLQRYLSGLILPLIECLRQAWTLDVDTKEYAKQMALASVYLGLLRLNIQVPDSPLDPGRAPLAKVLLIDRKLSQIRTKVTALRLDSGFTRGEFTPESNEVLHLLDEGESILKKRHSQEKKVVERIEAAPPFHELFREAKDFLKMVSSTETVIPLVQSLLGAGYEELRTSRKRAHNWQQTAAAFCLRMAAEYEGYEDITTSLVDAVHMIQDGLHVLTEARVAKHTEIEPELFRIFQQFPMMNHSETIKSVFASLSSIGGDTSNLNVGEKADFHFAFSLAFLTRLALKKRLLGLCNDEVLSCCEVLHNLTRSQLIRNVEVSEGESLEDIQEQSFREQFPDHRKEFIGLIKAESEDEDEDATEIENKEENEENTETAIGFSDAQIELLYSIYHDIFSGGSSAVLDSTRTLAFRSAYNAAYAMERSFGFSKQLSCNTEPMGAHVLAIAFSSSPKVPMARANYHLHSSPNMVDFQNEPYPSEVMSAAGPLERLMARATQLLTAFPGHSILLGIGKVCDTVRKFDIMTTPIGKVMTGLEVILRQAQDWEQHASDRVRLGTSLQEIGQLVASWRKLELESWSQLIRARKDRHVRKAQRHWIRLLSILQSDPMETPPVVEEGLSPVDPFTGFQCCTPKWVWKGISSIGQALSDTFEILRLGDLTELVKALDTFVLTSPLGEFEERLKLLKTCSVQLQVEHNSSTRVSNWKLQQSRALLSIWFYYSQFGPMLSSKLEAMQKPIESKLKDEVKLAKWDEQSYYALAESTERNHRKLMKVLHEFDECLGLNIGQLIQEETIRGIRSNVDSHDEFCSSVPSDPSMFPITYNVQKDSPNQGIKTDFFGRVGKQDWIDASLIGVPADSHLRKLGKYAKKMQSMKGTERTSEESWASMGGETALSLCDAIFERVGSLRAKSTRQMKERALVDLFRELKRNGFTVTKWSVPNQQRHMEHIFQLPVPNVDAVELNKSDASILGKAETYYARCLVEINAIRSEAMMLGSKRMSKREMDIMLNLSESGVMMLTQQRCLVANVITEHDVLKDCNSGMFFENKDLPAPQFELRVVVKRFESSYVSSIESLHQLSLFIRSSQSLLHDGKDAEWARDTIAKLESASLLPFEVKGQAIKTADMVTWDQLQGIEKECVKLQEAELIVKECREECAALGCLPVDVFDAALSSISKTLDASSSCKQSSVRLSRTENNGSNVDYVASSLSSAVERTLISFQNLCRENLTSVHSGAASQNEESGTNEEDASLWDCHKELMKTWASVNLRNLNQSLKKVLKEVRNLHDTDVVSREKRECIVGLVSDVCVLSKNIQDISESLLKDSLEFYSNSAKLHYVILRVFRVLLSQGYCSDATSEDDGGDADGDFSGMNFEDDQEGTGMGEGDGKQDVTDQLENEEQLLGLKSDEDKDDQNPENRESRQLDEDEAEQGMEMEEDFDGEMCDLPEKPADDGMEEQEGEELDRELGEDASPDEQVVDERMWNESDDEDEINKDEEKFEKDSGVEGEAIEGATRTKDEENENPSNDQNEKEPEATQEKPEEGGAGEMEGEEEGDDINEDAEDRYEDKNGVDVRENENEVADDSNKEDDQMQLDDEMCLDGEDNEEDAKDGSMEPENEVEDSASIGGEEVATNDVAEDDNEEEVDAADSSAIPAGDGATEPVEDETNGDTDAPDEALEENEFEKTNQQPAAEETHGIRSSSGTDAVMEEGEDDEGEEGEKAGDETTGDTTGTAQAENSQSDSNGGGGFSEHDGALDQSTEMNKQENSSEIPNPFKDPGDASKFWHQKLNVVDSNPESEESMESPDQDTDDPQEQKSGDFQYTSQDQKSSSQVLGEATEEEAVELEPRKQEGAEIEEDPEGGDNEAKSETEKPQHQKKDKQTSRQQKKQDLTGQTLDEKPVQNAEDDAELPMHEDERDDDALSEESDTAEEEGSKDGFSGNKVVSDLSKLNASGDDISTPVDSSMLQDEQVSGISSADAAEARARWLQIQGETHNLSRRLCEKLRLVMEPLVASKLRGDYRTGKRINMKRVIGYIASGYRKDKIWLRRTKPAKRDYRVLLAVDDSESMRKSGAGEMALRAMATLAVGMNQLEIGELGIASFGEDMKLLHPYHLPFTSESGADMAMNFQFDQPRTRTALCVESAIASLDAFGGNSSMQLVFMISDGRIERDSRAALKRLVREMFERNILLAMIIVEGEHKKKDSIVNMKEVTFEKGKPVVKRFIEDYPFPYYIILDDMNSLPEVLGDSLRQWFEMLAQIQSST